MSDGQVDNTVVNPSDNNMDVSRFLRIRMSPEDQIREAVVYLTQLGIECNESDISLEDSSDSDEVGLSPSVVD